MAEGLQEHFAALRKALAIRESTLLSTAEALKDMKGAKTYRARRGAKRCSH